MRRLAVMVFTGWTSLALKVIVSGIVILLLVSSRFDRDSSVPPWVIVLAAAYLCVNAYFGYHDVMTIMKKDDDAA